MRQGIPFLLALVLAACSTATVDSTSTVTASAGDTTTSSGADVVDVPPEIAHFRVKAVQVGDRSLTLAIADDPSLRAQGLMQVTDLRDLDGMLFFWRHDGDPFWMKDTLIPLDIVWFDEAGTYKDRASMVPCTGDPCPTYEPADGLGFRYAIEAPAGDLDWIDDDTVIVYTDD